MALESKRDNVVSGLCRDVELPSMARVRQRFDHASISFEEIPATVRTQLMKKIGAQLAPGMEVAIPCGSRGIAHINVIIKAMVDFVREVGAVPFVFPAMGSHGGATVEGQIEILRGYGVTETFLGCPIRATMDTVEIGRTADGMPVYIDRYARAADAILLCGRVKAHTSFRGRYESGLMKMAVIGMGKQRGAELVHQSGFINMGRLLPIIGTVVLEKSPVIGGLAILENAFDKPFRIEALTKEEIYTREPELLLEAKMRMGKLRFDKVDVLVVDRIGKDVSGDGMDPNVTGTFGCPDSASGGISAERVVVLDTTPESDHNAYGIGMADVTTKRLVDKLDVDAMYPNAVTSTVLSEVKIPIFTHSDREAIQLCLRSCNQLGERSPRILRIRDTRHLEEMYVSASMLEEVERNPDLELLDESRPWPFDEQGNLW